MLENAYQAKLIKKIKKLLPGCVVLKNDTSYQQGIPDLSVFYKERWAWLEVKKDGHSAQQPNQDWFVELGNTMSFGAFIYPENEKEVLDALQSALQSGRAARLS